MNRWKVSDRCDRENSNNYLMFVVFELCSYSELDERYLLRWWRQYYHQSIGPQDGSQEPDVPKRHTDLEGPTMETLSEHHMPAKEDEEGKTRWTVTIVSFAGKAIDPKGQLPEDSCLHGPMGTCIKFFTSHISHTPCISTLSSLVDQKGGIVVRPVPTEYVLILSALLVTHPPGSGSTLPAESCQFDLIINARARYELSHPHFSSVEAEDGVPTFDSSRRTHEQNVQGGEGSIHCMAQNHLKGSRKASLLYDFRKVLWKKWPAFKSWPAVIFQIFHPQNLLEIPQIC